MSGLSVASLVQSLWHGRLLSEAQYAELVQRVLPHCSRPQELVQELTGRCWLTPWQGEMLLHGRLAELIVGPYRLLDRLAEGPAGRVYLAEHHHMRHRAAVLVLSEAAAGTPEAVEQFYAQVRAAGSEIDEHGMEAYEAGPVGASHYLATEFHPSLDYRPLVGQVPPDVSGTVRRLMEVRRRPAAAAADGTAAGAASGWSYVQQRRAQRRRWLVANIIGGVLVAAVAAGVVYILGKSDSIAEVPASDREAALVPNPADAASGAAAEWKRLAARAADPGQPPLAVREAILEFRRRYPGTEEAWQAVDVLRRLPSPLDKWTAATIPQALQWPDQPPELVAAVALGSDRSDAAVGSVAFGLGDRLLAAAGAGIPGHVWMVPHWKPIGEVSKGLTPTKLLNFSPDSTRLAYATDQIIRIRHVGETLGEPVSLHPPHQPGTGALAWSPNGRILVSGGSDRLVRIWDATDLRPRLLCEFQAHNRPVHQVSFSPDGRLFATSSSDSRICLWKLDSQWQPQRIAVLTEPRAMTTLAAFSPDNRTMVCRFGSRLSLWDWSLEGARKRQDLRDVPTGLIGLQFSPDGRLLALLHPDRGVFLVEVSSRLTVQQCRPPAPARCAAFSSEGRYLAVGCAVSNGRPPGVYVFRVDGGRQAEAR
ncbi:MAG: hypothetical protein NZ700_09010 [Gemmataceae bacterium]|nr:hypothetical protein [Gemmataceae bacterium]MDW8267381.1 hypothetical protein [Gemmataceae bacterium]